jgi:hypothetical protein
MNEIEAVTRAMLQPSTRSRTGCSRRRLPVPMLLGIAARVSSAVGAVSPGRVKSKASPGSVHAGRRAWAETAARGRNRSPWRVLNRATPLGHEPRRPIPLRVVIRAPGQRPAQDEEDDRRGAQRNEDPRDIEGIPETPRGPTPGAAKGRAEPQPVACSLVPGRASCAGDAAPLRCVV